MVILLLFNQSSTWTIEQISQETRMKMEIVIQLINGLIKSSLLSCSSLDNEDLVENDVHINYPIKLMVNYRKYDIPWKYLKYEWKYFSEKFRINLNLPVKLAKEKQSKNFDQIVDDDRKFIIQVCSLSIRFRLILLKNILGSNCSHYERRQSLEIFFTRTKSHRRSQCAI